MLVQHLDSNWIHKGKTVTYNNNTIQDIKYIYVMMNKKNEKSLVILEQWQKHLLQGHKSTI